MKINNEINKFEMPSITCYFFNTINIFQHRVHSSKQCYNTYLILICFVFHENIWIAMEYMSYRCTYVNKYM